MKPWGLFLVTLICSKSWALSCPQEVTLSYRESQEQDIQVNSLKINKRMQTQGLVTLYLQGQLLIPIEGLAQYLELDVSVFPGGLDIKHKNSNCRLTARRKTSSGDGFVWSETPYDIYLDSAALAQLLDIEIDYSYRRQAIAINADWYLLPKITTPTPSSLLTPDYVHSDQYFALTIPVADVRVNAVHRDNTKTRANVNAYFDLLYQAAEYRLSDANDQTRHFLKLSRELERAPDARLVKKFGYEIGDINTPQDNLVAGTYAGKGLFFYTNNKDNFNAFTGITLIETVPADWRGELYRNGLFIDEKISNDENQLVFDNVQAFYGSNRYELRLFGPQGQTQVIVKDYEMGRGQIEEGKLNLSYYQVAPQDALFNSADVVRKSNKLSANYGLFSGTTLGLAYQTLEENNKSDDFFSASAYTLLGGGAFNVEFSRQSQRGHAAFLGYSGKVSDQHRVALELGLFDDYFSALHRFDDKRGIKFKARVNGIVEALPGLRWNLQSGVEKVEDKDTQWNINFKLDKSLAAGLWSNEWLWQQQTGLDGLIYRSFMVKNWGKHAFSASMEWLPFDNLNLDKALVEWRWPEQARLYQQTRIRYQDTLAAPWQFSHQLNWRMPTLTLTSGMDIDSEGDWSVNAGVTLSLGYDKANQRPYISKRQGTNNASLDVVSFIDDNRNYKWEPWEPLLKDVAYSGNQNWKQTRSNHLGRSSLRGLKTGSEQALSLGLSSIKDPFLYPAYKHIQVKTHPGGRNRLFMPMHSFSEVEGNLFSKNASATKPLPHIQLTLLNAANQVVARTRSESDGYFAFSKVPPGRYHVDLETKDEVHKHQWPDSLAVSNKGQLLWLGDLIVTTRQPPHTATISPPSGYYVQLGRFQQQASLKHKLAALPAHHSPLIKQARDNGAYYALLGPYSRPKALKTRQRLATTSAFSDVFIVNASTFSSSAFRQPFSNHKATRPHSPSKALQQRLSAGHQRVMQAPNNSLFCQLGSYLSPDSLKGKLKDPALLVVARRVTEKVRYTLLAGPYTDVELCRASSLAKIAQAQPLVRPQIALSKELMIH